MVTKKQEILRKNNVINEAVLNVSSDQYKVFLLTLKKIGYEYENQTIQIEKLNHEYCITAKECSHLFEHDIDNCYRSLKNSCKRLTRTPLILTNSELNEVWEIPVYSIMKYSHNKGMIMFKFSHEIIPYLSKIDAQYMKYDLKAICNMRSMYAIRLYELVMQFKNTGWIYKQVEELRQFFGISKDKLKMYADLKRRVIEYSVQKVNKNNPNIGLSFEEMKSGNKVVAIRFTFNKATTANIATPLTAITFDNLVHSNQLPLV